MSTSTQDGDSQQKALPDPLNKYEMRQRLVQSDNVEVWKAFDPQRKQLVAIKIIQPNIQADHEFPSRFMEEVKRISSLNHPNIVQIYDFGFAHAPVVTDTKAYIIMAYVEGETLAGYLRRTSRQRKFLSASELVRLLIPISLAIDYAHQQGIVHGDLKPDNILLDASNTSVNSMGQPILSDFGIAHILQSSSSGGSSPFASSYTAPEQAQGESGTERSDLYSLGVILYQLFTGVLPTQSIDLVDPIRKRFESVSGSTASLNSSRQPVITAVMLRNLAKNPLQRYPSAVDLVIALAKAFDVPVPEHLKQSPPKNIDRQPLSSPPASSSASRPSTASSAIGTSQVGLSGPTIQDETNDATYISPLPTSRPPAITPSTPSWAGISGPIPAASTPSGQGTPPIYRGEQSQAIPSQSVFQGSPLQSSMPGTFNPTGESFQTFPMTSTGQFAIPQAGTSQPPPSAYLMQASGSASVMSPLNREPRRRRGLFIALIAALIVLVVLAGSGLGYFVFFHHNIANSAPPIVGHAFFISSGLLRLNQNSIQGITDEVQINLSNIPNPQSGKSYYAWLLSNQDNIPAILLGALPLRHGQAVLTYVDPQHNNLLANYNHFLITEENNNPPPADPSPDPNAWQYNAIFSTVPSPTDTVNHFSLYDHLKHLLAKDPKLELVGLHGGLDIWLYKNTTKVLEAAGAARDSQKRCTPDPTNADCAFVKRDIVRILDYLDGSSYVYLEKDVPAGTPLLIDPKIARVALLEFDVVNQQPPGFLKHIGNHLRDITASPGATPDQLALATHITQDIANVQVWLQAVRSDAVKLEQMNNAQLSQAGPVLDDLFTQANYAFVGQFDPNTGNVREGVAQIHYNIQKLATFDVQPCMITNGQNSCA
jgi:serine/threonine protein kinase